MQKIRQRVEQANVSVADGRGTHLGSADSEDSQDEDDSITRKILPYNNLTKGLFMLFTEYSPRRFVNKLKEYLKESKDVIAEVSETQWQVNFNIERELDDEEIENGVKADSCDIRVELLKMPSEEDPIAVKFTLVKGSLKYFKEQFEDIESYFGDD